MEPINNANLQRVIRQTIYRLKLEFGALVDVYRLDSSTTDYDTGEITRSITRRRVRRAVKMPEGVSQLQYISPQFTQTQKPFITKGLGWDEVTNVFLFDGRDLRDFNFELEDWLVWNHERFEIKAIEELGNKAGWAIGTTAAKGEPAEELLFGSVESEIELEQDVIHGGTLVQIVEQVLSLNSSITTGPTTILSLETGDDFLLEDNSPLELE